MKTQPFEKHVWAEIDLDALRHNFRAVKARGIKKWMYLPWVLVPCLFGGAGYMEYFVQRHGKLAATGYSIMGACLAGIVLLGVLLWRAGMAPNLQKEHK